MASYMVNKEEGETLAHYLSEKVFAGDTGSKLEAEKEDVEGFDAFIKRYKAGLPIERAAVDYLKADK